MTTEIAALIAPVPTLDARSGTPNFDWPDAEYATIAEYASNSDEERKGILRYTVRHHLKGAPGIQALIDARQAEFAVEVRCGRSMTSYVTRSAEPQMTVEIDLGGVRSPKDTAMWPGVVAIVNTEMDTDGMSELWFMSSDGTKKLPVPRGRWLALGPALTADRITRSLLRFEADESLVEHSMSVEPANDDGDFCFVVRTHPTREGWWRDDATLPLFIAAALGRLRSLSQDSEDSEYNLDFSTEDGGMICIDHPVLTDLARKLEAAHCKHLWDDPQFDPLRAATSLFEMSKHEEPGGEPE